jgi:hypothetical protein
MTKRAPPPSRTADQFVTRLPDGMRDRIAEAAKNNNRSMNAEIVERLSATFTATPMESLQTIETQTGIITLLGHYLSMMTGLAKKGNPDKLEQILLIEALAKTLAKGEYNPDIRIQDNLRQFLEIGAYHAKGSSDSEDPSQGSVKSTEPSQGPPVQRRPRRLPNT